MGIAKRRSDSARGAKQNSRGSVFSVWYALFFLAGVLAASAFHFFLGSSERENKEITPTRQNKNQPWGQLEITPMILDRPDGFVNLTNMPKALRWFFPNHSTGQIAELIQSCDFSTEQKAALLDTSKWRPATNGWYVLPAPDLVRQMSPATRERIYGVLSASHENLSQCFPFACRVEDLDDWFEGSELPSDKIALVRKLAYPKFGLVYFADLELFAFLSTSNETYCLLKTLYRIPTLLVKLHVAPDSDIDALVKYWGRGDKALETRLLLKSLARVPGGASINISHFLPPIPRLRLYTYPDSADSARLDCFWTAFNFSRERSDYRAGDSAYHNRLLQSEYDLVQGDKQFGDVLILFDSDENAIHTCVYVADDIVFTKNGGDPYQPWVLMRTADMMLLYASDKPQQWRVFRKRGT